VVAIVAYRPTQSAPYASRMNIEAVIAALGGRYDADETEGIERVLREYGGTVPDQQLISEAALALVIWRRGASGRVRIRRHLQQRVKERHGYQIHLAESASLLLDFRGSLVAP